ncbi:MAG: FkbM family methyltransferase [Gemmatimonadaceae bacterium]
MSTPLLSASQSAPSAARAAKRKFFLTVLSVVPFPVKLWAARKIAPNLVRYLPGNRAVEIPDYGGQFRMALNTRFPIETMMIVDNYEPITRLVVKRLVMPGDHCVDVGANVGGISVLIAANVGPTGRVLSFEPSPSTYARLRKNLSLNPQLNGRLTAVQAGLADKAGELRLVEDETVPGNAALYASGGTAIPVITFDAAVEEHAFGHVNFIKIDVEGMEYEVLLGARKTLEESQPVMYFETMTQNEDARGSPQFALIEQLLKPMGYHLFDVKRDGQLTGVSVNTHGDNTLAVPAQRVDEVRQRLSQSS